MPNVDLTVGTTTLAVDTAGGGLRALRAGDWDVLDGYPAGTTPHGRRGHVLAPWPNRLAGGQYTWGGNTYRVPINDASHDAAIHGFVDQLAWTHLGGFQHESRGEITVGVQMPGQPGYPWPLELSVRYSLTVATLQVQVTVRNDGTSPAPLGVGMHPYLNLGAGADGTALHLPATARLPLDDKGSPSGPPVPFDGALGQLGERVFDAPLTGLQRDQDGWASVRADGPAGAITLSVDRAWPWVQLFTADTLPGAERRRSVAVEPNTCPPNALATGTDLICLPPGATWDGAWRLAWVPAAETDPSGR